jgi:hypothetical protein
MYFTYPAVETARHLLQRRKPPQRNGSSTQAKPTFVGYDLVHLVPRLRLGMHFKEAPPLFCSLEAEPPRMGSQPEARNQLHPTN